MPLLNVRYIYLIRVLLFIIRSALAVFVWHTDWNLANAYQVRTICQRRLVSYVADFLGKINHACTYIISYYFVDGNLNKKY